MNGIKKHKAKLVAVLALAVLLILAFFSGGQKQTTKDIDQASEMVFKQATASPSAESTSVPSENGNPQTNAETSAEALPDTKEKEEKYSDTSPEAIPVQSAAEQNETEAKNESSTLTCSLSVSCQNALGKTREKSSVLPENGVIFEESNLVFYEGETVFNVLVREMKQHKIHLEFVNIPIYNSAYIEGIGNLYEFDCGELSGWMYKVNGKFPNYGSSRYTLQNGDRIEWVYTCDLGKDVGGDNSARNGMEYE